VNGRTSVWGASDYVNPKFTGYGRDTETALDFAQARYMSAGLGRFMSPDPANAGADFTNPQSWNGYGYVLGNPVSATDPSGACTVAIAGITQSRDPNSGFTTVAEGLGAVQAYPYARQSGIGSVFGVIRQGTIGPNGSTATALGALQYALGTNSGKIDVLTYSGGAGVFTAAYGRLSASDQQRIGNIFYVSPGAWGSLATNGQTSILRGTSPSDVMAMAGTIYVAGTPVAQAACDHQDFACLSSSASAAAVFQSIEASGPCAAQKVFSLPPTKTKSTLGGWAGAGSAGGGAVSGVGGWDEFGILQLIIGTPTVSSTITYPKVN
jgi:RHS repeat-associated protein